MKKTNEILLRRRNLFLFDKPADNEERLTNSRYLAALDANLRQLGYCLSEEAFLALLETSMETISKTGKELEETVKSLKGANLDYEPMYPNFPKEVMEMEEAILYVNALIHYMKRDLHHLGFDIPEEKETKEYRLPLPKDKNEKLTVISSGTPEDLKSLIRDLLNSNISYSAQDKEDISVLLTENNNWENLIPEEMENRENMVTLSLILLQNENKDTKKHLSRLVKTSTDVMRIYAGLSGSDISLAKPPRFKAVPRKTRRLLLSLMENDRSIYRQMSARPEEFKQMLRYLHVDEFRDSKGKPTYPNVSGTINKIRNGEYLLSNTFFIDKAIKENDIKEAVSLLSREPGIFARRLDEVIRKAQNPEQVKLITDNFAKVTEKIPTPLLLNLKGHFANRNKDTEFSVYIPKGQTAKTYVGKGKEKLSDSVCTLITGKIDKALTERFEDKGNLGKVYLDESLKGYRVPLVMRNLSKESRVITRGSELPTDNTKNILRSFVWWKQDMDVDLSASILDKNYKRMDHISFTSLKNYYGCHSGDITYQRNNGHEGECEFIDIDLDALKTAEAKYVVFQIHNYSGISFDENGCKFGYMEREELMAPIPGREDYYSHKKGSIYPNTGEIFEPLTVKNIMDIRAKATSVIPFIYDVEKETILWADMALGGNRRINALETTMDAAEFVIKACQNVETVSMYDLLRLHVIARGTLVDNPLEADEVFSLNTGTTPFETEKIISRFIADGKDEYCYEFTREENPKEVTICDGEAEYTILFGDKKEDCKIMENGSRELTVGDLFFKSPDLFSKIQETISSHYKSPEKENEKKKTKEIER